jgi:hypothetical protein
MPMVPKTPAVARTYRTVAFAALAGVTPRALRQLEFIKRARAARMSGKGM